MKVALIPVVIGAFWTDPKALEKRFDKLDIRRTETIQTTVLLKSDYLAKSWRFEETCCHSDSCEKPPVKTGLKHLHRVKIIVDHSNKNLFSGWDCGTFPNGVIGPGKSQDFKWLILKSNRHFLLERLCWTKDFVPFI